MTDAQTHQAGRAPNRLQFVKSTFFKVDAAWGRLSAEERAAATRAAELLGVNRQTFKSLEALVDLERATRVLREALFPRPL